MTARNVGQARSHVEGRLKVTGEARYAAEYDAPGLLHGCLVPSRIARGRVARIDTADARAIACVVRVFTHADAGKVARFDFRWRDMVAPPGSPFRPLQSDQIQFADQPVALVVAETWEAARDAAALVEVTYEQAAYRTD